MDDRLRFRPPDKKLERSWDKAMETAHMAASAEDQRQAMQDAMRAIWPDLVVNADDDGWIVYRDGLPLAPAVDTASGYGVEMPWHGGRIYFKLDKDVPDLQAVLRESAKIVGPLTDWHEIRGKLEEAFKERPIIIEVFGGRTHSNPYADKVTVRVRRAG